MLNRITSLGIMLFTLSACKISRDLYYDEPIIPNGDFNGTWMVTNLTNTNGKRVHHCNDLSFDIVQTADKLTVKKRTTSCNNPAYTVSTTELSMETSGNDLFINDSNVGIITDQSIIFHNPIGSREMILEIAPNDDNYVYLDQFEGSWNLQGTVSKFVKSRNGLIRFIHNDN